MGAALGSQLNSTAKKLGSCLIGSRVENFICLATNSSGTSMPATFLTVRWWSIWPCWPVAREPAHSAHAARARYVRIISIPLTCITRSVWCEGPTLRGTEEEDRVLQLTGSPRPLRLKRRGQSPIYLTATQGFRLVRDTRFAPGEWKATTRGYAYTVYDTIGHEPTKAIAWHWHPGTGKSDEPHLHVYREGQIAGEFLNKLHLPGERVAFEAVVNFVIQELGVDPLRDDWSALIDSALERFTRFRTWPKSGGPLTVTEAEGSIAN